MKQYYTMFLSSLLSISVYSSIHQSGYHSFAEYGLVNWSDAQFICDQSGLQLPVIESNDDLLNVLSFVNAISSYDSDYHYISTASSYKAHPSADQIKDIKSCLAVNRQNDRIENVWCDRNEDFDGGYILCATKITPHSSRRNLLSTKSRYIFVDVGKSWQDAQSYCQSTYETNLGTIVTDEQLNEAVSLATNAGETEFWIGLNDLDNEGTYKWISGAGCGYVVGGDCEDDPHWKSGEPNGGVTDEDCVELSGGEYNDASCSLKRSFLCENPDYEIDFILVEASKTWSEAQNYCETQYGTDLATIIDDKQLNDAIAAANDAGFTEIWIGLNDIENEFTWLWQSGVSCDYAPNNDCRDDNNWYQNEPNDSGGEDCGSLDLSRDAGSFNDKPCSTLFPFFCQKNEIVEIRITACDDWSNGGYSSSLIGRVHGHKGSTPKFIINSKSPLPTNGKTKTYYIVGLEMSEEKIGYIQDIKLNVNQNHGYCLKEFNLVTKSLLFGVEYFGNGVVLNHTCTHSFMYLSDDKPLFPCFSDTLFSLKNNSAFNDNNDGINKRGIYNLNIQTCPDENAGIKLANMKDNLYLTVTGKEALFDYIEVRPYKNESECLYIKDLETITTTDPSFILVTTSKTWQDAENYCQSTYGTHLATITSDAEFNEAVSIAGSQDVWIGLNDQDTEGVFEWVSGVNCSYAPGNDCANDIRWASGEPNDSGGNEDCAVIWHIEKEYNDAACTELNAFLCQNPVSAIGIGECDDSVRYIPELSFERNDIAVSNKYFLKIISTDICLGISDDDYNNNVLYPAVIFRSCSENAGAHAIWWKIEEYEGSSFKHIQLWNDKILNYDSSDPILRLSDSATNILNDQYQGSTSIIGDVDWHTLTMTYPGKCVINSCGSSYDTWLYLENPDGDLIASCDDCGSCGNRAILEVDELKAGQYQVGIGGFLWNYGTYDVSVTCDYIVPEQLWTFSNRTKYANSYSYTQFQYLDHFIPSSNKRQNNFEELGDFVVGDVEMSSSGISFYHTQYSERLYAVKVESIDYENKPLKHEYDYILNIDGTDYTLSNKLIIDQGRYMILYSNTGLPTITSSITMTLKETALKTAGIKIHIYFIFDDDSHDASNRYQLPFIVDYTGVGRTWFQANDYCLSTYSTPLASIHSNIDQFLIYAYFQVQTTKNGWIGLNNLYKESEWSWKDNSKFDYDNWAANEPNAQTPNERCGMIWGHSGTWNDESCNTVLNMDFIVCASPFWNKDKSRSFQINANKRFNDKIVSVLIGNNHQNDHICIEDVSVNDIPAKYITNPWIGGTNRISNALYKYPVCSTTITNVRVESDPIENEYETSLTGIKCVNHNRIFHTQCSIEQSYTLMSSASTTFQTSTTALSEDSWSESSIVSNGTSNSKEKTTSTTDETSWEFGLGKRRRLLFPLAIPALFAAGKAAFAAKAAIVGAKAVAVAGKVGVAAIKGKALFAKGASVVAKAAPYFKKGAGLLGKVVGAASGSRTKTKSETESETNSESSFEDKSWEKGKSRSEGVENTNGTERSYEVSTETEITCAGAAEVPPFHSLEYNLKFNQYNASVKTYFDMRLSICSSFMNPNGNSYDEVEYIWIYDIPGSVGISETTSCSVEFQVAETLTNSMDCASEMELAFASDSMFIPQCNKQDPKKYDGCQCDNVDQWAATVCFCTTTDGNFIDGKSYVLPKDTSERTACVDILQCDNVDTSRWPSSQPTISPVNAAKIVEEISDDNQHDIMDQVDHDKGAINNNDINALIMDVYILLIVVCFAVCGILVLCGYLVWAKRNRLKSKAVQKYKELKKENIVDLEMIGQDKENVIATSIETI